MKSGVKMIDHGSTRLRSFSRLSVYELNVRLCGWCFGRQVLCVLCFYVVNVPTRSQPFDSNSC